MKILIVGKFYSESFAKNIYLALRNLNSYDLFFLEILPCKYSIDTEKSAYNDRVFSLLQGKKILDIEFKFKLKSGSRYPKRFDLSIVVGDVLSSSSVQLLKEISERVVNWFPDSVLNFGKNQFLISNYDYIFLKDPFIVRRLNDQKLDKFRFLAEGFHYEFNRSTIRENIVKCSSEKNSIDGLMLAGNAYPYRVAVLEKLAQADKIVNLYGPRPASWLPSSHLNWKGMYLKGWQKIEMFQAYAICLNSVHFAEIEGYNARFFEIFGAGGLQLVDRRPSMESLLPSELHQFTYKTLDHLLTLIDLVLSMPVSQRLELKLLGFDHAWEHHTIEKRLRDMISLICY